MMFFFLFLLYDVTLALGLLYAFAAIGGGMPNILAGRVWEGIPLFATYASVPSFVYAILMVSRAARATTFGASVRWSVASSMIVWGLIEALAALYSPPNKLDSLFLTAPALPAFILASVICGWFMARFRKPRSVVVLQNEESL
ncbi:MAG: hypothetical protein ABIY70_02045 [Capsulimonas sp.]|uniref:hypothetical protein n=1 Tax=Capsulimonas sp. TaxID=2494211 RepID=UPI003264A40F